MSNLIPKSLELQSFWAWGNDSFSISPKFLSSVLSGFSVMGITPSEAISAPDITKITINNPRFLLPSNISKFCVFDKKIRIRHTYGRSTREMIMAINGIFNNCPDYVAFPENDSQIQELLNFCNQNYIYVVPFGGGSSVVGGINITNKNNGIIVINMMKMDKLIQINLENQTATFQTGIYGPNLEKQLTKYNLTFRNYPQSFEFSTLGGWLSTHSAGHFATGRVHIDETVCSLKIITPTGIIETKERPPDGAGPYSNNIFLGSEGIYGIISEATIKVLRPPKFRVSAKILFKNFFDGIHSLREICQTGMTPSNCRLFDFVEATGMGIGDAEHAVLLLGFESVYFAQINLVLDEAVKICEKFRGKKKEEEIKESDPDFRNNFTSAPYLRNELLLKGVLMETLETCVGWDGFKLLYENMINNLNKKITELCGNSIVTCRITHCYAEGIAPYFTIITKCEMKNGVEIWDKIKETANNVIYMNKGSITHHHAVGRDHKKNYLIQNDEKIINLFKKIKGELDPKGIMNPGVLFDSKL